MTETLIAEDVKKRFRTVEALGGIDLVVEPGQVLAVLGPNGAGKTTFLRAVATLLVPDEGTLRVAGIDGFWTRRVFAVSSGSLDNRPPSRTR